MTARPLKILLILRFIYLYRQIIESNGLLLEKYEI